MRGMSVGSVELTGEPGVVMREIRWEEMGGDGLRSMGGFRG